MSLYLFGIIVAFISKKVHLDNACYSEKKNACILYLFQKSVTPKQGTPSSVKRKANQQPQRSSEKRRSSGRKRSNTYTLPEGTVPSPTVKEMMDSMKEGMSKDELKNNIQKVLNKNSKSSGKDKKMFGQ